MTSALLFSSTPNQEKRTIVGKMTAILAAEAPQSDFPAEKYPWEAWCTPALASLAS